MLSGVTTPHRVLRQLKAVAKPTDRLLRHSRTMLAHHVGEVLGQCTDLLLQKEEGGLDRTQLSFINNKGECSHLVLSIANHLAPG